MDRNKRENRDNHDERSLLPSAGARSGPESHFLDSSICSTSYFETVLLSGVVKTSEDGPDRMTAKMAIVLEAQHEQTTLQVPMMMTPGC